MKSRRRGVSAAARPERGAPGRPTPHARAPQDRERCQTATARRVLEQPAPRPSAPLEQRALGRVALSASPARKARLVDSIDSSARFSLLMAVDSRDFGIAQLEALGLSLRVINLLEEKLGIIWLHELLEFEPESLRVNVPFLGQSGVDEIIQCLGQFNRLASGCTELARKLKPGVLPPR